MKRFSLVLIFAAQPAFAQVSGTPSQTTPAPSSATASPTVSGTTATPSPSPAQASPAPSKAPATAKVAKHRVAKSLTPSVSPKPDSSPEPKPHKEGWAFFRFFGRIFGGGHKVSPKVGTAVAPALKSPHTPTSAPAKHATRPAKAMPTAAPSEPKAAEGTTPVKPTAAVPSPTPAIKREPAIQRVPAVVSKPVAKPVIKASEPAPQAVVSQVPHPEPTAPTRPAKIAVPTEEHPPVPEAATPSAAIPDSTFAPESANSERSHYLKLRGQAASNAHVAELRAKMESATGDGYKEAAHEYIEALFSQIRQLDPKLGESLNRKEQAYKRRIDSGKRLAD